LIMAEASIPVDLTNSGQVFACLGFLEAAEVLIGDAEGGFEWSFEAPARFFLSASGLDNPFEGVLEFLAQAEVRAFAPYGFDASSESIGEGDEDDDDTQGVSGAQGGDENGVGTVQLELAEVFPARRGEAMALPIRVGKGEGTWVELSHWCDGSGVETFKLYSGNRSAQGIARAMIKGTREAPRKGQAVGDVKTHGIATLWAESRKELVAQPFDVLAPMGGSFNFDPRGAWTAIDAGYSPNTQGHRVVASPVVELLAAWGLQHTRPVTWPVRQVRYGVWGERLAVELARVALQGALPCFARRLFRFELALSGKNKVITFAQEEILP
jgi:CRISPR-associated protein Csb3